MCAKYYELRCMLKKNSLVNVGTYLQHQNWRYFRCPVCIYHIIDFENTATLKSW